MSETWKFVLGPVLALIPILTWELFLKPARVRRNVALSILAEIDTNLGWLLAYWALRNEKPKSTLSSVQVSKTILVANAAALGELPFGAAARIIDVYRSFDTLIATTERLEAQADEYRTSADTGRRDYLAVQVRRCHGAIGHSLDLMPGQIEEVRRRLHQIARENDPSDSVPVFTPLERLKAHAAAQYPDWIGRQGDGYVSS